MSLIRLKQAADALVRLNWLRPVVHALVASPFCCRAIIILSTKGSHEFRRGLVKGVAIIHRARGRLEALVETADRYHLGRRSAASLETYLFTLIEDQQFVRAWNTLNIEATADDRSRPNIERIHILLAFELGLYAEVVDTIERLLPIVPRQLRGRTDFIKGSFAAGQCLLRDKAVEFFGRQFKLIPDEQRANGPAETERVKTAIAEAVMKAIHDKILVERLRKPNARIGVFFTSSTEALGHAILDVYHFIALARSQYDRLIFVGAERQAYRPASRVCLEVVEQYGDYVETHDTLLLDISWMSLGTISVGPVEIVVENYWNLLREVFQRTRNPRDPFKLNQWHMSVTGAITETGESFCDRHGISLEQPIVVLHARDHRYHAIVKQSHRNTDIDDYRRAIEHLLREGYQVIRVGDRDMQKLSITEHGYFELPFMAGYSPRLDPFFISRARFMIGCQSGPCAYARVFGKPLLTVNAIYHYTLLPGVQEMGSFKRYLLKSESGRALLPEEIMTRQLFLYDNSHQFDETGVEVHSMSADELVAAVKDMICWLEHPDMPETPEQRRFRDLTEKTVVDLQRASDSALPIADYLGYALPGYRISPTVARMRGELLADSDAYNAASPNRERISSSSLL